MAFTFVVESGSGLITGANSYVSVSDASDIIATNIHADTAWVALSTADQEKLLAWATRYLDTKASWKGTKSVEDSPLRWPRTGVYDRDNVLIDSDVIPQQLKVATAEMARYLIAQDRTIERDQDGLVRLKADVVEIEFREGYTLPSVPDYMQDLITGLGYMPSSGMRFSPIAR